jgi:NADH dehydrogenase/NADH:ubiquinone oxidoreductase subunit G
MVILRIDGLDVQAEEGATILETCKFYGIDVPTLCYMDGLSPYGGCRLCLVEVTEGKRTRLVASCTYPVAEGIKVRTHSRRVMKARLMVIELMVARCPTSKVVQDLASQYGVKKVRFKLKFDNCLLCGLCVRVCEQQMMAGAIDFVNRGKDIKITTPFDITSDQCRRCGACMYVCPACQLRCQGPEPPGAICGGCMNLSPSCLDYWDDAQCFMSESGCGTCVRSGPDKKEDLKKEV